MKYIFITFILFSLLLSGCTSSTSPASNPNFSADVQGVHWLPNSTVFGVYDSSLKEIWIHAVAADSSAIDVNFVEDQMKPGSYNFVFRTLPGSAYYGLWKAYTRDWYYSYNGSLTITAASHTHATGSFSYQSRLSFRPDSVTVTNGKFDVAVYPGMIPF